jgi:tetratricopeptide (TPR) repeat protein
MMRKLLATVTASMLMAPAGAVQAQDEFSFDIVESQVTDTDKQKIDDAKDLLAQERFSEALGAFEGILADPKQKKAHEAIKYEVCKAFYKMGAYHASLSCFEEILQVGPKHSMFGSSREWLFFIARKIKDELGALRLIARYAKAEDIPAEYQSELGYALGRYYFLTALELGAKGVEVEAKPDPPAAETPNEGALDFGDDEADKKDDKGDKKDDEKKDEGGFDFGADELGGGDIDASLRFKPAQHGVRLAQEDDDMFGIGEATTKDEKKGKAKPKAKPKGKDKKEEAKAEEKSEPPPPPEPKKERHAFEGPKSSDEALKLSLDNLGRVKKDFALYAQSLYIKGLVHFARGEFEPAVNAFQEVVRMTNPKGGTVKNDRLREMAFFSLARIHYQFEQFRYAIFYYNRVSRDSEQWLESLFESSWAHFRLAEYEKALGNLVTLQSPFFQDEYYPESAILKAITFYENCRYPEARAFLGEFEQNYGGVLEELKRLTGEGGAKVASADPNAIPAAGPKTATQLFEELTELEKKVEEGRDDANRSFALTARLLRLALSDKRVKGYREAIEEIDQEKAQLQALEAPFNGGATHASAMTDVDKRREELVALAGTLLKDKLEAEKKFLTDLNSKLVRIQFEIAKGEKDKLESKLSGSQQDTSKSKYQHITAVDDERLYWPFEGEYWRDELGTYQYTLTEGCRPPDETTITGN